MLDNTEPKLIIENNTIINFLLIQRLILSVIYNRAYLPDNNKITDF
jgi:hypothetical protein